MNVPQWKALIVRLAYAIAFARTPTGEEFTADLAKIADDFSNLDAYWIPFFAQAPVVRREALLNGLLSNAEQQVSTLKGLLG